jgi:hypothetical protein
MDLNRLYRRISTSIAIRLRRGITWSSLLTFMLTVGAFIVITIQPHMRATGGDWGKPADWGRAAVVGWLSIIAAIYLKGTERFKRTVQWSNRQRRRRRSRKLTCGLALRKLGELGMAPPPPADNLNAIQQQVLQAAALSVESILSADEPAVTANLLLFAEPSLATMKVAARSTTERNLDAVYSREDLLAWSSIREGKLLVIDDTETDVRCRAMTGKSYKTVAAAPITRRGRAIGSITLDSETPFVFYGKASDISLQLEPYLALLALILPADLASEECHYVAGH